LRENGCDEEIWIYHDGGLGFWKTSDREFKRRMMIHTAGSLISGCIHTTL